MNIPTLKEIRRDLPEVEETPQSNTQTITIDSNYQTNSAKKDLHWFILPGNKMSISESAYTIFSEIGPTHTMFSRGGAVVEVIEIGGKGEFRLIEPAQFCSRIERFNRPVGAYVKKPHSDGYNLAQKACPKETAEKLLASTEAGELLPSVTSVSNSALIVKENSQAKVLDSGYYPNLGGIYIVHGGGAVREIDPKEAVLAINSLLDDFSFQTEGDKSRAIASFLTPALRFGGHISGSVPVDVAEATESQSGKTYRHKVIAALYRETLDVVTQIKGVGGGDEPFFNSLCRGRPFIQFDNWRGKLDSPTLEAFITANGQFGTRGAYRKWGAVDSRKFYLMLTSNGFEATRDFCNRSNIIRIKKQEQEYQYKPYEEGDLIEHIRVHQSYYQGCVFSVIRDWIAKGEQKTAETRHDFREWCQVCDWIVRELFGCAPPHGWPSKSKGSRQQPQHDLAQEDCRRCCEQQPFGSAVECIGYC